MCESDLLEHVNSFQLFHVFYCGDELSHAHAISESYVVSYIVFY